MRDPTSGGGGGARGEVKREGNKTEFEVGVLRSQGARTCLNVQGGSEQHCMLPASADGVSGSR